MDISRLVGLDVLNNILKKVYAKITDETSTKIELNTQAIESNTNRINSNETAIGNTNKSLTSATKNLTSTISSNYSELNSKIEANDAKIKENANKMATRDDLKNTAAQIREQISTEISGIIADAPESFDTLKEISDWISTHEGSAATMNSSIAANTKAIEEINSKLSDIKIGDSIIKSLFDVVRPIGDIYVQYPQQANPNELWGVYSTWSIVNYDGAFFRAEGTNANAFIEKTGNLIKQKQSIKRHDHKINHTHTRGTMEIYGQIAGAPCANTLFNADYAKGAFNLVGWGYGKTEGVGWNPNTSLIADFYASRTWTGETSGPSLLYSEFAGSDENRPANYTIRVWKRTA